MRYIPLLSLFIGAAPALRVLAQGTVTETLTTFITITASGPVAAATASSIPTTSSTTNFPSGGDSSTGASSAVDPSLIPAFGVTAGIRLNDGTPRCAGLNGKPIDCDCPPDFNTFLNAVDSAVAGGAQFPSGSSASDQLARLNTCIVVLQNIHGGPGTGQGCPAVSTNWVELQGQLTSQVNG